MTKTGIIRLGILCIAVLITCTLASIVFILNTQYLTPVTQWLLRSTLFPSLKTEKAAYEFPLHLTLQKTRLTSDSPLVDSIDIWLNPYQTDLQSVVLDSLLIDGAEITAPTSGWHIPHLVEVNQLAAKNITYTTEGGMVLQNLDIQIEHPSWQKNQDQALPHGAIQLYARKLLWRGELLKDVLLTGEYSPDKKSYIQGVSFNWRNANLSLAAQEHPQGWDITNLSAEKLDLSLSQIQQLQYKFQEIASDSINKIERIDILTSQFSSPQLKVINCDLSASNLSFNHPADFLWSQQNARLSLSAESISVGDYQWIEPDMNVSFSSGEINLEDFNASILQGNVHFSGKFSPEAINIHEAHLSGLKLFIEQDTAIKLPWIQTYFQNINELHADNIKIQNSQIIQLAHKPYWQLSGINLDASDTQISTQHHWGLWSGKLNVSVDSLSYDDTIASQGVLEIHRDGNSLYLDRLFIPYNNGYIKAIGKWANMDKGAPWKLNVEAYSLPLKLIHILPFPLEGLSDFSLKASGLSGDSVILGHTLSGELRMSIRDGNLALNKHHMNFSMPATLISADRGKINLPETQLGPEGVNATIHGEWNLAESDNDKLILSLEKTEHQYNLLSPGDAPKEGVPGTNTP
ncbi:AsmA family protein [Vibrio quintilis]|uniref:AsmA family protein n=1 Tax=Vibrio quintilis TaxID=1117707 RepID=A0A1M7Z0K3_9VIBR|nr:AsmA family protein [Vibrio quintilis]SHO58352.1 AsmA family protein [Vibrio quintilis]